MPCWGSQRKARIRSLGQNTLWWTNAFVGQYTISAVAVDNAGVQSDPQSVNITVALDSDGNGLPDYWKLQYFGHLGVDPNADADGDSISNLQEYQQSTDPTDFYNGRLPYLEILGGNDQAGNYDSFLPQPVSIKVSGSQFFDTFVANAPCDVHRDEWDGPAGGNDQ